MSFQAETSKIAQAPCVLRRESFGCVIYRRAGNDYIPCDNEALAILLACKDRPVEEAYQELAPTVSKVSFDQFVQLCQAVGIIHEGRFDGYILDNSFVNVKNHLSAPTKVHLQLTRYCNLKCPYCWAEAGQPQDRELTLRELDELFAQFCQMGVFNLEIGGGEPLGRKDFPDVVALANSYGIVVNVATNATLATKALEEKLEPLKIDTFRISLEAGSEKIYDNVRGVRSYRKAMRGLAHLRRACPQAKFIFHCTLYKDNYSEIPSIVKKAEELKVDKLLFSTALPVGRGALNPRLLLSAEETRKSCEIIQSISQSNPLKIEVANLTPPKRPLRRAFEGFGCECGRTSIHISSNGGVYPSGLMSCFPAWKAGDVRQSKFFEIWNNSPVLKKWRSVASNRRCKNCSKFNFCRGDCRTRAFILTKDLQERDPFCLLPPEEGV